MSDETLIAETQTDGRPSVLRRVWHWIVTLVGGILFVVAGYSLIAILGLLPVNNDFVELDPMSPQAVTIFVRSSGVHSDIIMPIENSTIDWREHFPESDFKSKSKRISHVAIGWGDRGFYLETPTWDDLTVSTAANAIFLPSESVMHVTMTRAKESADCRSVVISQKQYQQLVDFVLASFRFSKPDSTTSAANDTISDATNNAANAASDNESSTRRSPIPVAQAYSYSWNDRFYEANGSYHAFSTCNCWVGRGLRQAGVKVAWFTPLPRSVLVHWRGNEPGWHWIVPPLAWLPWRRKVTS